MTFFSVGYSIGLNNSFFALLRAGLWEQKVRLLQYSPISFEEIYKLAEEQSVVGLVAAGLEHIEDIQLEKSVAFPYLRRVIGLEQRNIAMNHFIGEMIIKSRQVGINTVLVKGQGVAQCYERPLWRSSGDVDFFFDRSTYDKAVSFFLPLSSSNKTEGRYSKHIGMTITPWLVEVHGSLRTGLSKRLDRVVDTVQSDTFKKGGTRTWKSEETDVYLPNANNDIFFVFTHFIKHLYKGGISFRQICDWCRLLWKYYATIDVKLLEKRLSQSGLLPEWRVFSTLAIDYLGYPSDKMFFYKDSLQQHKKAAMLCDIILNGTSEEDKGSFRQKLKGTIMLSKVFPLHTILFLPSIFLNINLLKVEEIVFRKRS